jgi:hypothetical protein
MHLLIVLVVVMLMFGFAVAIGTAGKLGKKAYDSLEEKRVPAILFFLAIAGCLGALYWSAWTAPDGDLPYTGQPVSSSSSSTSR